MEILFQVEDQDINFDNHAIDFSFVDNGRHLQMVCEWLEVRQVVLSCKRVCKSWSRALEGAVLSVTPLSYADPYEKLFISSENATPNDEFVVKSSISDVVNSTNIWKEKHGGGWLPSQFKLKVQKEYSSSHELQVPSFPEFSGLYKCVKALHLSSAQGLSVSTANTIKSIAQLKFLERLCLSSFSSLCVHISDCMRSLEFIKSLTLISCESWCRPECSCKGSIKLPESVESLKMAYCSTLPIEVDVGNKSRLKVLSIYECQQFSQRYMTMKGRALDFQEFCVVKSGFVDFTLDGWENCKKIHLEGCKLRDTMAFSRCVRLRELNLQWCLSLSHVFPLSSCDNLCVLDLSNSQVKDVTSLKSLPLLYELDLSFCPLENCDLSCFGQSDYWINLTMLRLVGCTHITNLYHLGQLESLEVLDLSATNLQSLASMVHLEEKAGETSNINETYSSWWKIPLSFIAKSKVKIENTRKPHETLRVPRFTALKELYLRDCSKLFDMQGLSNIEGLRTICVDNCESFTSSYQLSSCKSLEQLSFDGATSEIDFTGFKSKSLVTLKLKNCKYLKQLENLKNCPKLRNLDIRGCDVTSKDIVKLNECNVLDNVATDLNKGESIELIPYDRDTSFKKTQRRRVAIVENSWFCK